MTEAGMTEGKKAGMTEEKGGNDRGEGGNDRGERRE